MKSPYRVAKKAYSNITQIDDLKASLQSLTRAIDNLTEKYEELNKAVLLNQAILKSNYKVSNAPISAGNIRLVQEGNVIMLELLKKICKEHHFEFILWGGSLLGAIRHNDFIPWDDDVDVVMPREQFNQMFAIMDELFTGTKLFYVHSEIIRIYYGQTPLQIDIFPLDFYPKQLKTLSEKKELSHLLYETYINNIKFNWNELSKQKRVIENLSYSQIEKLRRTKICPDVSKKEAAKTKSTIMRGFEVGAKPNRLINVFDYDWIYPIKEHKFMNTTMPIVNQPDTILSLYYGDYQTWPKDVRIHTDINGRYNFLTLQEVKDIVSGKTNLLDKTKD